MYENEPPEGEIENKPDPKYKYTKYAGIGYTFGNIALCAKEAACKLIMGSKDINLHDFYTDPVDLVAKLSFLISSAVMWSAKDNPKRMAISNVLAFGGSVFMAENNYIHGNMLGTAGYVVYAGVTSYSAYISAKEHQREKQEREQRFQAEKLKMAKEPLSRFEEITASIIDAVEVPMLEKPTVETKKDTFLSNAKNMFEKYMPKTANLFKEYRYAPLGIVEASAASILAVNAAINGDSAMFGIALTWFTSSGFLIFAKDKPKQQAVEKKQLELQPA